MKRHPYLPDDEDGIHEVLVALDTNLPGALATKYEVTADQILRIRHGRCAYGWYMLAKPIAQQFSQSLTDKHDSMKEGEPGALEPLPDLPLLPPVPTFTHNAQTVTAQMEPGFFDFLGRFVQYLKNHDEYEEPDGLLLKILGAVVPAPDQQIVPVVNWKIGPDGRPILIVKKTPFQGYTVWVKINDGPVVDAGFSTTREFALDHPSLPVPPAGATATWKVQVQYRYKNAAFGQKSQWVEIPVRGV